MRPVVSVFGEGKEEKTAGVEALVVELTKRGYTVGTLKHHVHDDFDIDIPGKASYRHRMAGAREVAVSSPTMYAYIRHHDKELDLEEAESRFSPAVDIIIAEGYGAAAEFGFKAPVTDAAKAADDIEERFFPGRAR